MRLANIIIAIIGVLLIIYGIKQMAAGAEVLSFIGMILIGLVLSVIGFMNYMKLRRG